MPDERKRKSAKRTHLLATLGGIAGGGFSAAALLAPAGTWVGAYGLVGGALSVFTLTVAIWLDSKKPAGDAGGPTAQQ